MRIVNGKEMREGWYSGEGVNDKVFVHNLLEVWPLMYVAPNFYDSCGIVAEAKLQYVVCDVLQEHLSFDIVKIANRIITFLRVICYKADYQPSKEEFYVANGTYNIMTGFRAGIDHPVINKLPVAYNVMADEPILWKKFLNELMYQEDIPALQEYMGYCLLATNKAQKMLVIKGAAGIGKSQIGVVLRHILGAAAKDGCIAKLAENRFARADISGINLMIDDDMQMEELKHTNYIKSIVTASGKMDLERKGIQSYQGNMFAKLIGFSNGGLHAKSDQTEGFYRRQLIIVTRDVPANRVIIKDLGEQLCAESEGILKWMIEGLMRLIKNNWEFSVSDRMLENQSKVRCEINNVDTFLRSEGYIEISPSHRITSKMLYNTYVQWCDDNLLEPYSARAFCNALIERQERYNIVNNNNQKDSYGHRVRGYDGIGLA